MWTLGISYRLLLFCLEQPISGIFHFRKDFCLEKLLHSVHLMHRLAGLERFSVLFSMRLSYLGEVTFPRVRFIPRLGPETEVIFNCDSN